MNREEQLTEILQKIDRGEMDIAVAFDQVLRLFSVIKSVCSCDKPKQRATDVGTNKCSQCGGEIEQTVL